MCRTTEGLQEVLDIVSLTANVLELTLRPDKFATLEPLEHPLSIKKLVEVLRINMFMKLNAFSIS